MGGIRINESCETAVPHLFAVGEVASGAMALSVSMEVRYDMVLHHGYYSRQEAARRAKQLSRPKVDLSQVDAEQQAGEHFVERKEGVRGSEIKTR